MNNAIRGSALLSLFLTVALVNGADSKPLSVLIVDGQNNHRFHETTPAMKEILESCGRFEVDVATTPATGGDMSQFRPSFSDYDVVVSNYNGDPWSATTKDSFENFIATGGGFVCVHAADNAFPEWRAYNRMIGLGGLGDRDENHGPYIRWLDAQQRLMRDHAPGPGGTHGKRVPFMVVVRQGDHPITRGLPNSFLQTNDELYARLRGPAENMHVLATGFSAPEAGGTGQHEPVLMTIQFGNGRVFHTTLGHDLTAMNGVAFQATLQRGTEWAATGRVKLPAISSERLSADQPSINPLAVSQTDSIEGMPDTNGDGWKELFNGSDLSGWNQKNGTATYRVEDGAVVGKTAVGSPNSFLCTDQEFDDFELAFEVKVDVGLNSGVQIRSASKSGYKNGRVHGPQVEIETAPGESGYLYSEGTGRGWITTEQPIKDAYQNDQWNRFVVRARGNRIQTWVNGRAIADARDDQSSRSGFVGLQVHGIDKGMGPFEVRWRDIRIRSLGN